MPRTPPPLVRDEAEEIVDLLEAHSTDHRVLAWAASVRRQWGMCTAAQSAAIRKQRVRYTICAVCGLPLVQCRCDLTIPP